MERNVKIVSKCHLWGVDILIFVTLGTQDKDFSRLLNAVEKSISNGNIKEKVIVQAGFTKFASDKMEIYDYLEPKKMNEYFDKASLIICHGGVGSILKGLEKNKKIIAVARVKKYNEHTNDHQLQIVNKFSELGYILSVIDCDDLDNTLKRVKNFTPKKYISNNNKFICTITEYIDKTNYTSWLNKILSLKIKNTKSH